MPESRAPTPAWARTVGLFLAVFVGYVAGAQLSVTAFGASELGPAFFPPAGVTVAAMLLTNRARWPVIVAAIHMLPDRMGTYGLSDRQAGTATVANTKYGQNATFARG